MTRGIRAVCAHCGFKHWWSSYYNPWGGGPKPLENCERCKRDLLLPPPAATTETVCINRRMVERQKQA